MVMANKRTQRRRGSPACSGGFIYAPSWQNAMLTQLSGSVGAAQLGINYTIGDFGSALAESGNTSVDAAEQDVAWSKGASAGVTGFSAWAPVASGNQPVTTGTSFLTLIYGETFSDPPSPSGPSSAQPAAISNGASEQPVRRPSDRPGRNGETPPANPMVAGHPVVWGIVGWFPLGIRAEPWASGFDSRDPCVAVFGGVAGAPMMPSVVGGFLSQWWFNGEVL